MSDKSVFPVCSISNPFLLLLGFTFVPLFYDAFQRLVFSFNCHAAGSFSPLPNGFPVLSLFFVEYLAVSFDRYFGYRSQRN